MDKLVNLKIKVIRHSLFVFFIGTIIFTLVDFGPLLLGWVYGAILGMLSWLLLSKTLEKAVRFSPNKARIYATFNYMLRYAVIFIALYVAMQRDDMHMLTAILGLVIPKMVILWNDLAIDYLRRKNVLPPKK